MPKYTVLAEAREYFEVEADNAADASMNAYRMWKAGEISIVDCSPEFICEECDLIEEEENV
jgi:hypothetical protein